MLTPGELWYCVITTSEQKDENSIFEILNAKEKRLSRLLEKPEPAQSPVWLFHDPVLLFDLRKRNRILNLDLYILYLAGDFYGIL